jgi:hypothetical protein
VIHEYVYRPAVRLTECRWCGMRPHWPGSVNVCRTIDPLRKKLIAQQRGLVFAAPVD